MTRIHAYLLSLPCTTPEQVALRVLLAAWAQGPLPRESARRWAEAAGAPHLVDDARKFIRGTRPWPSKRKSRSPLIVAVETWEAAQPVFNLTQNTMSGLCGDGRIVD